MGQTIQASKFQKPGQAVEKIDVPEMSETYQIPSERQKAFRQRE